MKLWRLTIQQHLLVCHEVMGGIIFRKHRQFFFRKYLCRMYEHYHKIAVRRNVSLALGLMAENNNALELATLNLVLKRTIKATTQNVWNFIPNFRTTKTAKIWLIYVLSGVLKAYGISVCTFCKKNKDDYNKICRYVRINIHVMERSDVWILI